MYRILSFIYTKIVKTTTNSKPEITVKINNVI